MDFSPTYRSLTPNDYAAAGRIFFCAVHDGTRTAYDLPQRLAWAGPTIELAHWKARLENLSGYVAELSEEPVGFLTIDRTGYIDLAFVMPSVARRGIGKGLLLRAENWASAHKVQHLTTKASLIARPFFERNGWQVQQAEEITRTSMGAKVTLRRFAMHKPLG